MTRAYMKANSTDRNRNNNISTHRKSKKKNSIFSNLHFEIHVYGEEFQVEHKVILQNKRNIYKRTGKKATEISLPVKNEQKATKIICVSHCCQK